MASTAHENGERRHLDRLTLLPILFALVTIWSGLIFFAALERRSAIDHVQSELVNTVSTLADFNELADRSAAGAPAQAGAVRTAALWNALLQYPSASFWVTAHGRIVAGQPPAGQTASIQAQGTRGAFTVYAALPQADALQEWKRALWVSVAVLCAFSLALLVMTRVLAAALRQRAVAERDAAASAERARDLADYRTRLEQTVERRTEELAQANAHLETELTERRAAQDVLREHDALLNVVTKSAAELLGSHSHERAIATVLELVGTTISASRVLETKFDVGANGHLLSSLQQEWCRPGTAPMLGVPAFEEVDLTAEFPDLVRRLQAGEYVAIRVDETHAPDRFAALAERSSVLNVPITVDDALWGSLNFIDAAEGRRTWTWAETDTLKTLAGLFGIAIARERYIEELADANTIVQNSPTILVRVRGQPPFQLMYISDNIAKFGLDPVTLIRSPDWLRELVDVRDRPLVDAVMASILGPGPDSDSFEFRLKTGPGAERWMENRYLAHRDANGKLVEIESILIEVTERKASEQKIERLARTDFLTGLANRGTFIERLAQTFAAATRAVHPFAILYLDLDSFKSVNDTLGHAAGDELLQKVAERLCLCTRETDLVARLGGDEFAVLQSEVGEPASAGILAAKIQSSLSAPYELAGGQVQTSASIGISLHSAGISGPDAMLAQADIALYRSKQEGRNQYRFYSAEIDREVVGRVELSEDLKRALADGQSELEFYFEPQMELLSGKAVALKACVRWRHPTRGLLNAADFVPILEKSASGIGLARWLLDKACAEMHARRAVQSRLLPIAIDVGFYQLKQGDEFIAGVREALEKWNLAPSDLELDVTEATFAQACLSANDTLRRLHEIGVPIAVEDFGAGCSLFEYIHDYGVRRFKLSKLFVADSLVRPERTALLLAFGRFAREAGIGIVAEGRLTNDQREVLLGPKALERLRTGRLARALAAVRAEPK